MELIDFKALRKMVPYSRAHVHRLEGAGLFPKRLRLNPVQGRSSRVAWVRSEVEDWIASRPR